MHTHRLEARLTRNFGTRWGILELAFDSQASKLSLVLAIIVVHSRLSQMDPYPILFHEEYRPPRPLTWMLVLISAGAVAGADGRWREPQPSMLTFFVVAGALCVLLVLEFVAIGVEVTETEVLFRFAPFYLRRIAIADIRHWEVRTYFLPSPGFYYRRTYSWRPPRHCVELTMDDGRQFSITSEHPEQLSHAISRAKELIPSSATN